MHGSNQDRIWCAIVALAADLIAGADCSPTPPATPADGNPNAAPPALHNPGRHRPPRTHHRGAPHEPIPWTPIIIDAITRLRTQPAPAG